MQSNPYRRAQAMVLMDKYNMAQNDFNAELSALAKRYFEVDGIKTETFADNGLQIVLTLSVKKVKQYKRV